MEECLINMNKGEGVNLSILYVNPALTNTQMLKFHILGRQEERFDLFLWMI